MSTPISLFKGVNKYGVATLFLGGILKNGKIKK
jgi:hypothetical protein